MGDPRERLAALLGAGGKTGAFSARRAAPSDDLALEVRGIGELTFPISAKQVRQLADVARPAAYGLGERTLVDARVRDTWEVPRSRVKIDRRRWNETLLPTLERLARDLGVPEGGRLKAELHSMLLYRRGQFFLPHQDSEKADDMIGTLVVTLPGAFRGGSLVVEHGGVRKTYRPSPDRLTFVAFYADCRHEVRPIQSGHRVTLTYNLLLSGHPSPPVDVAQVGDLARCVGEHFAAPNSPNRLVYLLDHEYTQRGLSWERLKGSDAGRVAALREAAGRSGCEAGLALAEVREIWSCSEPDWNPRGWRDDWSDTDDDDDWTEPGDLELDELIESSITLDHWVDLSGQSQKIATTVGDDEVCATTPSHQLTPQSSEYEGYMGNYGNTMDRWYRRGAVVLWPRDQDFAVRAEASPSWALKTLAAQLKAGDVAPARERAAALEPFWGRVARFDRWADDISRTGSRRLLSATLPIAYELDEPVLAAMLLHPFRVELLAPSNAETLAAIGQRFGESWVRELLAGWAERNPAPYFEPVAGRPRWIGSLTPLCRALQDAGGAGPTVAAALLDDSWSWLSGALARHQADRRRSSRRAALDALADPIAAWLQAAPQSKQRDSAIGFLCAYGDDLLPCLMRVIRMADPADLDVLARHCVERLQFRLSRPARAEGDWSIELFEGCACGLCHTLQEFLADPARRVLEWPLAKQGRQHVHQRIDADELPVRHQTRRAGRPYTLVLTKTSELFERDAAARRRDQTDLAWLRTGRRLSGQSGSSTNGK